MINRELAGLKRPVNFGGSNGAVQGLESREGRPVARCKQSKVHTLSESGAAALVACCSPYLQDLLKFAIKPSLGSEKSSI
jgi:hypothetical protein